MNEECTHATDAITIRALLTSTFGSGLMVLKLGVGSFISQTCFQTELVELKCELLDYYSASHVSTVS
jgi:hypothetical protein